MTAGSEPVTLGIKPAACTHTVSAGMAGALIEFAVRQGADRETLLAAAGVHPHAVANEDARLPFTKYLALYTAAERICEDDAFALRLGESIEGMDLVVCHVGQASPTMGAALEVINRYGRLAMDLETQGGGDPFQLEHTPEGVWLVDATIYPENTGQITETSFARLSAGTRQITSTNFVRMIHLMRSAPADTSEHTRVFGAAVHFGQRRNGMLLDPEWLSVPLPATSRYADGVLETHAERLMEQLDWRPVRRNVSEVVVKRLEADATVSMDAIARAVGTSRPSLYRSLRAEGTTFEELVGRVKKELATSLLREGRSIDETAERLGFSDRSAFSRAFKRWVGTSPGAMRRNA